MSSTENNRCKINELYILPEITNVQFKEQRFLNWSDKITFNEDKIILPDSTTIDANIFMNNQLQFDNGSYTKFVQNYYYDNII